MRQPNWALRIFCLKSPMTAADLAVQVSAHPRALYRLLRALASLGIFSEGSGGVFAMTPAAELLRRDSPNSLRSTAVFYGEEFIWRAFGGLTGAVETGRTAFRDTHHLSFYEYLEQHPRAAALFHEMMTGFSGLEASSILAAYDFSIARVIVDIGGGQGGMAAALLARYDQARAIIFDAAPPTDTTRRSLQETGVANRIKFKQGDFFKSVPPDGDLYMLKSIIHNWDDPSSVAILTNCARTMAPEGRILIADRLIPEGNAASEAKLFDLNMMVTAGGEERTEAEYAALLTASGLRLTRVVPTSSYMSLIEARKS